MLFKKITWLKVVLVIREYEAIKTDATQHQITSLTKRCRLDRDLESRNAVFEYARNEAAKL